MRQRAAVYCRVSTADQRIETQQYQLRELAAARGFEVVREYTDRGFSGAKARRPGLDAMMADARRRKFDVVLVAAFDRASRSVRDFLRLIDELESLNIQLVSAREAIDTSNELGRIFVTVLSCLSQMERNAIADRVRQGLHRAKMQGVRLGRRPLETDREALQRDRRAGMSLTNCAKKYGISRASVIRFTREEQNSQCADLVAYQTAPKSATAECVA